MYSFIHSGTNLDICVYSRYFAIQSICEKHPEEEEKELVFIGVCDL